jgi:hypothetical protein
LGLSETRKQWSGEKYIMKELNDLYSSPSVVKVIKMDLQEVGCGGMDWIEIAHDRNGWRAVVDGVMILRVASNVANF